MSRTLALLFIGIAIVCVGIVFNAGQSLALQEGASATAVAFAIIAGILLYASDRAPTEGSSRGVERTAATPATGPGAIEQAFAEGPFGRERIAVTLDAVERASRRPDLPAATPDELDRLWSMKPAEFRAYIAERLDRLERET
jgi:hypothetical protein